MQIHLFSNLRLTDMVNTAGRDNGLNSPLNSREPKAWWDHDGSETDPRQDRPDILSGSL